VIARAFVAEVTKFWATRSAKWCTALAFVALVGIPLLIAIFEQAFIGVEAHSAGQLIALLVLVVMAVIATTVEYRSGMIRTSLSATPQRPIFYAVKVAVAVLFTAVTILAAIPIIIGIFTVVAKSDVETDGRTQILAGMLGFTLVTVIFANAVAFLLRSAAGAIAGVIIWIIVVENVIAALPRVGEWVGKWLPFRAGAEVFTLDRNRADDALGAWPGFGVFCLWTAALTALSVVLFTRRDA
jgi:ABC-2 type transport system permease protein